MIFFVIRILNSIQGDSKLLSAFSWLIIFKTVKNKIKLHMEYENVTPKVLCIDIVLAALMSGRKYGVISKNGDYSRESNVCTMVFRNKVRYQNATSLQYSIWKRSSLR
jgi:hypothetical protein